MELRQKCSLEEEYKAEHKCSPSMETTMDFQPHSVQGVGAAKSLPRTAQLVNGWMDGGFHADLLPLHPQEDMDHVPNTGSTF